MDTTPTDDGLRQRANTLYWKSDESVNQIAEDLELSKGSLYNLVEPLPAGLTCPRCGEEMEYANRTARERGLLTCPACDLEEDEDVIRAEAEARAGADGRPALPGEPGGAAGTGARRQPDDAFRSRILWGSALLGTAAGLALALWARRK